MVARAGFCAECGQDVWLRDGGGCVQGHAPLSVQSARVVPLPQELDKFNWGAFFFPVLWPLMKGSVGWAGAFFGLRVILGVVEAAVPSSWGLWVVLFAIEIGAGAWYGRNANRLLWDKTPHQVDVSGLLKSQRTWGIVGLVWNGVLIALGVLGAVAGP